MGFSFPPGLAALGFLAILVWIWLRERRQRSLEIPSLLLWRSVREETRRRGFPLDPLFLVQAALLALLGLAVARPYRVSESPGGNLRRAVLLFDTSASMRTIEEGERRFDTARRKAREVLAALDPAAEVMVVAVEARPRVVVAFTRDRVEASRAVESVEPGDGPSRLALGLQLARSARGDGSLEVFVFTDLPRAELAAPLGAGERLRYFRFGRSDDNVAIAALRVYQNPFQEAGEARAYALVKNYSRREKEAAIAVTLEGRPLVRETFRLGPRESRAVAIRRLPGPGRLEARLEVADALDVDDRALAFVRPARSIRLLVVTASSELATDLRAVAEAVPAIELVEAKPGEAPAEAARNADVALFHGWVPEPPLAANALVVHPPAGNALFEVERDVVGAQILDWNERDPILQDLRYVEALPLGRARMIRRPEWARTLIASRAGEREFPLAFAGELGGRRIVVFAFDLAERSVRRSENLSLLLLVLNAIRWLAPPDPALPVQVDVGERYRDTLAAPAAVTVKAPDGTSRTWPARTEIAVDVERRGVYELRVGGRKRELHANLFDPGESDVGREGPEGEEVVEADGRPTASSGTARSAHPLEGALALAGLGLLFAEWIWAARRRRAARA